MIQHPNRFRTQRERERAAFLRRLTYAESVRMTEELLSCGLLEQVGLREADHPVALRHLLHGRTR
jgi:hypothetical protein